MVFGLFGSKNKTKSTNESVSNQTITPSMPDWWKGRASGINEDLGYIGDRWGMGKMDPAQQAGVDALTGLSTNNAASSYLTNTTNPQLAALGGQFQAAANRPAHQLTGAAPTVTAPQIAAPGTLAAGNVGYNDFGAGTVRSGLIDMPDTINAERVAGGSAYDSSGQYIDAYGTGVLDPSLADYDEGTARAANAFRAQAIGGGGQAGGAQPVAAGVLAGEAARGRGALSASIRSDILDKSFGFGGQDSSRNLQAATTNAGNDLVAQSTNVANRMGAQSTNVANTLTADTTNVGNRLVADSANAGNRLTADTTNVGNRLNADSRNIDNIIGVNTNNAGNALTASGQNASILNSRDLANLQAKISGDATSMSALSALGNIIQTQGSNAITAENQTAQNAIRALEAAGIPLNQALQIIQAQLGGLQGVEGGYGTTATGSDKSVGTGSSTTFGFSGKFGK